MPKSKNLTPVQELHNFMVQVQELRRLQERRKTEKTALLEHAITNQEKVVDVAIAQHMQVNHIPKPKRPYQSSFNNFLAR